MTCRICGLNTRVVLDLGESPPANTLLDSPDQQLAPFPLVLELCEACGNLQLRDCLDAAELYRNYLYVTPDSTMLRKHYEQLHAELTGRGYLEADSFVLEVGSNAGLLLQYLKARTRKVLGIDPAANICALARQSGIDTVCDFFNAESAARILRDHGAPNLVIARHCMAHNADPHVMIAAAARLLRDSGYLVIENAYGLDTVEKNEFDQIYHEHMFYFTVRSMQKLLALNGMHLVDVMLSAIHGGTIVFVAKKQRAGDRVAASVAQNAKREIDALTPAAFERFASSARNAQTELRALVSDLRAAGKTIATYGATAKGNTLLNYVGLTRKDISYCADSTPMKQGKYLPKSGIPVVSELEASARPPDYYLLTAWNYRDEIIAKVRKSGNLHSRFIVPVPNVHVL